MSSAAMLTGDAVLRDGLRRLAEAGLPEPAVDARRLLRPCAGRDRRDG